MHPDTLSPSVSDVLPIFIVIAGPNGAGKTTFASEYLPGEAQTFNFINADLIAAGLHPFNPERGAIEAGRLFMQRAEECLSCHESFAIETTLSGQSALRLMQSARARRFRVILHFLQLDSVELAFRRVQYRVANGGHSIPETVIRRRFNRGLENLERAKALAHDWQIWNTSTFEPRLIDES